MYQRIRPIGVVIVIVLYGLAHLPVELPPAWHALVVEALHAAIAMQAIAEVSVAMRRATATVAWVARKVSAAVRRAGRWIADRVYVDVFVGKKDAVRRARLAAGAC